MTVVTDTDERLRKWLVNTAEKHGAAVMHVAGDDRGAPFAFSVGAWRRFGQPEAVVIGLPRDVAHTVINIYVRRVGNGDRFVPGRLYEGFLDGCPITVENVAKWHYPEFLGSAFVVYGDGDFPALQLIVSTPDGKFPWHDDAPGGFAGYQPVLTDSGRPESWVPGQEGP
jgi:hypothetical protein